MLYRSGEPYMSLEDEEKRNEAVEAGRTFTSLASADVWAKDAELVERVRAFLGGKVHWHERFAKSGTDLQVVRTLMGMVQSGSVVVIPEEPVRSGGIGKHASNGAVSFWGVENFDPPRYASVQERYQAQIAELQANETPWAEIQAMNDSINQKFMHAAVLADPLGTLPTFARAGWISKYGLPDLSTWNRAADMDGASDSDEGETPTPLSNALPFELGESTVSDDVIGIAARGVGEAQEAECFSQYEADLIECNAYSRMTRDPYTYVSCKQQAFNRYNQCRGY
jgi:hypothetical protein